MIVRLFKKLLIATIPLGIGVGILLFLSYGGFFKSEEIESMNGEFKGELIIHQGGANHFRKGEARGGWLILTKAKLVFRPHGVNIQKHPIDIDLMDVEEVVPVTTLVLVPNGLVVKLSDGTEEKFVVSKRKQWAQKISNQL